MAQASAVVDVVRAKTRTHQLLEQIRLFVTALGRAKTRQGFFAMCVSQLFELAASQSQGFVPRRFAEHL